MIQTPTKFSGVTRFYELFLKQTDTTIYLFGENHSKSGKCKDVSSISFMDFIEQQDNLKSVDIFIESSYTRTNKDNDLIHPSLMKVKVNFKKSSITAFREKFSECLYGGVCKLKNSTATPCDFRTTKLIDGVPLTFEHVAVTFFADQLYLASSKINYGDLRRLIKDWSLLDLYVAFLIQPSDFLLNLFDEQALRRKYKGERWFKDDMHFAFASLKLNRHVKKNVKNILDNIQNFYDEQITNELRGYEARKEMIKILTQVKNEEKVASKYKMNELMMVLQTGFNSMLMDAFIILSVMNGSKDSIVLSGSDHTDLYLEILTKYGADKVHEGKSEKDGCLYVE